MNVRLLAVGAVFCGAVWLAWGTRAEAGPLCGYCGGMTFKAECARGYGWYDYYGACGGTAGCPSGDCGPGQCDPGHGHKHKRRGGHGGCNDCNGPMLNSGAPGAPGPALVPTPADGNVPPPEPTARKFIPFRLPSQR
jgi:hypothetical protein